MRFHPNLGFVLFSTAAPARDWRRIATRRDRGLDQVYFYAVDAGLDRWENEVGGVFYAALRRGDGAAVERGGGWAAAGGQKKL